jgi:phage protein D
MPFGNLAPRYLIEVEGTELKEDVTRFIRSVEFLEQENSAARISIDVATPALRFVDAKTFAAGNKIDLWMGYVDRPLAFMGRGIVVRPNPRFPRRGMPTMRIVAHDLSRKLMDVGEKDRGKVYKRRLDSEIAEEIFKEIEAAPFAFATKGRKTRVRKRGVNRWQFLVKLARLNDFVVFVKYDPRRKINVGYFGPADVEDQPEKFRFSYGTGEQDATLLEFWPEVNLSGQASKLEMVWTDPKTRKTHRLEVDVTKKSEKTLFTGTEGRRELKKELTSGPSVTFTIFGQRTREIVGRPFKSVADAKRFGAAWFQRMQDEFSLGRGQILGLETLRRGQVHELDGIGTVLSGDWHFTSTSHRMGGGIYETGFTARKVVLENVLGAPAGVAKVRNREAEV